MLGNLNLDETLLSREDPGVGLTVTEDGVEIALTLGHVRKLRRSLAEAETILRVRCEALSRKDNLELQF